MAGGAEGKGWLGGVGGAQWWLMAGVGVCVRARARGPCGEG